MNTILYPGTFDPVTNGHMDLVERGRRIFDRVVVGVSAGHHKKGTLFDIDERVAMMREAVAGLDGVEVRPFDGLLVSFAQEIGATAVLRGLRAISDYEYETQMALMNRRLAPGIEILFLPADERNMFVNSTLVKEIARLGGDVEAFVPAGVMTRLLDRFGKSR